MKKLIFSFFILSIFTPFLMAQTIITEDFESYDVGDYLAESSPNWVTWNNLPGSSEDVQITDEQSFSGTKSIFIDGQAGGGVQDVVLQFGEVFSSGIVEFSMKLMVDENAEGAYFNFQQYTTNGTNTYSAHFMPNDTLEVHDRTSNITFPKGEWMDIYVKINLSLNNWTFYMNGICVSSLFNGTTVNQLAGLDLYPLDADYDFWVDDISFSHSPDDVFTGTDARYSYIYYGVLDELSGREDLIKSMVENHGTETITSMEISYSYGDNTVTELFDNLSLASGEVIELEFSTPLVVLDGFNELFSEIVSVNGQTGDDNPCNSIIRRFKTGYTPLPNKNVFIERGAGTGTGGAVYGIHYTDEIKTEFPDQSIVVAVHYDDVMECDKPFYINFLDDFFNVKPGRIVVSDRALQNVASNFRSSVLKRLTEPPSAILKNKATFNELTNELTITVEADFLENMNGDNRFNILLTEDNITGDSPDYDQANSATNAPPWDSIVSFFNLPDPVPADQMVYNDVLRDVVGNYSGIPNSLPDDISAGDTHVYTATMTVSEEWDFENLNIISVLLNDDREVDQAEKTTAQEALDNTVNTTNFAVLENIKVFPNPFSQSLNIELNLLKKSDIQTRLVNASGMTVFEKKIEHSDQVSLNIPTRDDIPNGLYYLQVETEEGVYVQKIIRLKN